MAQLWRFTKVESINSAEDNPQELPAGRCRPGLSVLNLDEFHERIIENHITCIQEPEETFGTLIAQYLDPDGLSISVSEERKSS